MAKRGNVRRAPPGSVRIIGGQWRSRRLPIVEGSAVRPTPDRVRETLFNWLRDTIEGARCLDLFAGTGVLGFEALSRGAREVYFVERDAQLVTALRAQAAAFGVAPKIVRQDVKSFLNGVVAEKFDVAFLDPPYDVPVEPLLEILPRWLRAAALVYVERPRAAGLPEVPSATWTKRSHAGAVEYGLLSFETA